MKFREELVTSETANVEYEKANGNHSALAILQKVNERHAIHSFANGLRSSGLRTIVKARNYDTLKDAIVGAQEEEQSNLPQSTTNNLFRPRGNGQVERANRTVIDGLATMGASTTADNWDSNLSAWQQGINSKHSEPNSQKQVTDDKEPLKFSEGRCFRFEAANPNVMLIKYFLNEEFRPVSIGKRGLKERDRISLNDFHQFLIEGEKFSTHN
nr:unnamed protein product [Callosobruchus chinensis]